MHSIVVNREAACTRSTSHLITIFGVNLLHYSLLPLSLCLSLSLSPSVCLSATNDTLDGYCIAENRSTSTERATELDLPFSLSLSMYPLCERKCRGAGDFAERRCLCSPCFLSRFSCSPPPPPLYRSQQYEPSRSVYHRLHLLTTTFYHCNCFETIAGLVGMMLRGWHVWHDVSLRCLRANDISFARVCTHT